MKENRFCFIEVCSSSFFRRRTISVSSSSHHSPPFFLWNACLYSRTSGSRTKRSLGYGGDLKIKISGSEELLCQASLP